MPKKLKPIRWDDDFDGLVEDYVKRYSQEMQAAGIAPYTNATGGLRPNASGAIRHALMNAIERKPSTD